MKKKVLALLLIVAVVASLCLGLIACNTTSTATTSTEGATDQVATLNSKIAASDLKIGLICLHGESSTYDANFINSMKAACTANGIPSANLIIKTGIDESSLCYDAAVELVGLGCDLICADSFGHESFIMQAAKEYPNVQFCHATGTQSVVSNLANFHDAFASIYEGRFLAGVAAGMKLNEMIAAGTITADEAVVGYVGAFPYAEVKSGYTSFYLGVKYICKSATMKVNFTNSWYDETAERNNALALINQGCVLISQHADSWGAPKACQEKGVPNVSYNGSTKSGCETSYLINSRIDWSVYYSYCINCMLNGYAIADDCVGTIASGSVVVSDLNETVAAAGTQAKIDEVKAKLVAGTLQVYDTSTFTVNGEKLTSYKADCLDNGDYVGETEVIMTKNGITYFAESYYRSAPYFDIDIDGITILG